MRNYSCGACGARHRVTNCGDDVRVAAYRIKQAIDGARDVTEFDERALGVLGLAAEEAKSGAVLLAFESIKRAIFEWPKNSLDGPRAPRALAHAREAKDRLNRYLQAVTP